jgi:hypothetical protein
MVQAEHLVEEVAVGVAHEGRQRVVGQGLVGGITQGLLVALDTLHEVQHGVAARLPCCPSAPAPRRMSGIACRKASRGARWDAVEKVGNG